MTDVATEEPTATKTRAKAAAKPESLNIYQLINAIRLEAGALAPVQGKGVPFPFRGIDGTVNHLSQFLNKYGVITAPNLLEHKVTMREIGNAKAITQSEVIVCYTFYAPDGSSFDVTTAGLAQDYSDRSAAQAQSVAYRIALLQTFTLPTQQVEPEEAGEQTMKYIADAASGAPAATRTGAALGKAAAAGGNGGESIDSLRAKVKAAAGTKGLTGTEINGHGSEIRADFFDNAEALAALLIKINALPPKGA